MMAVRRETVTVSGSTGGAGASTATDNTSIPINGEIVAVYLAYTGSPPAGTTDVTIAEATVSPALTVLTISNAATDAWFFPMFQADNTAGTDITNQGKAIKVSDYLSVTIAQANDNDGVTATIVWDDLN